MTQKVKNGSINKYHSAPFPLLAISTITRSRLQKTLIPQRSARASLPTMGMKQYTDTPVDTVKSQVYIPTTSPPYENPLDLRFPLHWSRSDGTGRGQPFLEWDSPEYNAVSLAEQLARQELEPIGAESFRPAIHLVKATLTSVDSTLSPPYFEVGLRKEIVSKELHEAVTRAIAKHFGHMKDYRPIIRYYLSDFDERFEAWQDRHIFDPI